ncbi:MAG: hypothetical protein OXG04_19510 [Acidobacteria bacterium]|nr:hypothetical protein [Acidobacteriota bacterium]
MAARDLSRYFILGWTEEGTLARELEERRGTDDPYPELSRAALYKEELLVKLADRPEELSEEEWDAIHEVGEQTIRTLRTDAETS